MDQYEKFEDKPKAKSNIKSNFKSENHESDNKKKLNFKINVKSGLDENNDHRKMVNIKSKPKFNKSVDFNVSDVKVKSSGPGQSESAKKKNESAKSIVKIRVLRDDYYQLGFDMGTSDINYGRKSHGADLKNDNFKSKSNMHDRKYMSLDKSDEFVNYNFQTEGDIGKAEKVKSKTNLRMKNANKTENTDKIYTTHITEGTKYEIDEKTKNNYEHKTPKKPTFKAPPEIKNDNFLSNTKSGKSVTKLNPNMSKVSNGENSRIHNHHKFPLGQRKFFLFD